ncbi:hypothetical protein GGR53DRAFT_491355 [Hypoxylon sp. FL1150]|nr:hypothetical protein GGR53DRAFT_491355 [Hypoxylon sp. FL1150]
MEAFEPQSPNWRFEDALAWAERRGLIPPGSTPAIPTPPAPTSSNPSSNPLLTTMPSIPIPPTPAPVPATLALHTEPTGKAAPPVTQILHDSANSSYPRGIPLGFSSPVSSPTPNEQTVFQSHRDDDIMRRRNRALKREKDLRVKILRKGYIQRKNELRRQAIDAINDAMLAGNAMMHNGQFSRPRPPPNIPTLPPHQHPQFAWELDESHPTFSEEGYVPPENSREALRPTEQELSSNVPTSQNWDVDSSHTIPPRRRVRFAEESQIRFI